MGDWDVVPVTEQCDLHHTEGKAIFDADLYSTCLRQREWHPLNWVLGLEKFGTE